MDMTWMKRGAMVGFAATALIACGEGVDTGDGESGPATDDGVTKQVDGKADAWNWRNDPERFRAELDYNFENLPQEGQANETAWAASYWPYYQDGINYRWQGEDELSPAEKYDRAFNGWEPAEDFMDLKPYDEDTCEWDDEYYESIGPAASWTSRNTGNWTAHNGVDDDGDGVEDADECGWGEDKDFDGVETWWGICHAWAPAAILEKEPVRPVTKNGVTFDVSDLKGLLIQQYHRTDAYMLGGRCNAKEVERDETTGRIINSECRDLNAGTWHVIVTNFLGKNSRPFVIERIYDYEIWNQPLVGYEITEQREISLDEAHELLEISQEEGNGEFVHGVEEESIEAREILAFVNNASHTELDDDARLDRRAADNIVDERPFDSLAELDDVSYVGPTAFERLVDYAPTTDYLDEDTEYAYNPEATRFVEIRMTTDWVTESHQNTEPRSPVNDRYVRNDRYHYIVELDDEGTVLGGEWLGSSITSHPDFVWLPVRPRSGNPHLDIDEIRDMIRESRQDVDDGDDGDDSGDDGEATVHTFSSEESVEIPDNDPAGASSVIDVDESGTVKSLTIDLDIEHTYRGDLIVELTHGGVTVNVYDGSQAEQPWSDDVTLTSEVVDGFLGGNLSGEWELVVYDTMWQDTGNVTSWSITAETD